MKIFSHNLRFGFEFELDFFPSWLFRLPNDGMIAFDIKSDS